MGGFSLWHWLVVLVIVVLVFGTKRLKNVGRDVGEAIRGFKKGVHDSDGDLDDREDRRPAAQLPDTRPPDATPAPPVQPARTDSTVAQGEPSSTPENDRTAR